MEVRERRCRKTSPERCVQRRVIKPTFRKVQVVYYLSRNGQLEHPHIMEVAHLAHQQLRLSDAMDRLTVLRGKGMPCLYSWSCKRSYKNGYVWYDLAENDIIYPSEGAEYILKGSELIEASTEKFQQVECSNRVPKTPEQSFHPKPNAVAAKRHSETEVDNNNYKDDNGEEEEPDEEDEEKTSYTSSNTSQSRCSRGVSTDEIEFQHHTSKPAATELTRDNTTSPPSTESSSTVSDPPPTEQLPNRLLQLIACGGGSVSFRGKNVAEEAAATAGRKSSSTLHKEVLRKRTVAAAAAESEISCMSENPRFGNLQSEEKEYFSGSIIESATATAKQHQLQPSLKKSSSYNEERSSKAGLGEEEAVEEEELRSEKSMKSKCIPRKKPSSRQLTK